MKTLPILRSTCLVTVILMLSTPYLALGQTSTPSPTSQNDAPRSTVVNIVGCLGAKAGEFNLTDENGKIYHLVGQTAGLQNRVGDQLEVSGKIFDDMASDEYPATEATLEITKVRTLLRRNPNGVPPVLGSVGTWNKSTNHKYGLLFHFPETFGPPIEENANQRFNFVGPYKAETIAFESRSIAMETFPDSNFVDGSFTAVVNPNISNEGTCLQFQSFWAPQSSLLILQGVKYSQTLDVSVGGGSFSDDYSFHTFQNGLCFEFHFGLFQDNPAMSQLPCSVRPLSVRNKFQLMKSVLSRITFLKPEFIPTHKAIRTTPPVMISLTSSAETSAGFEHMTISWSSAGADSVQLRFECTKGLYVSGPDNADGKCGQSAPRNFEPSGSATFILASQLTHRSSFPFVLTVEPLLNGAIYSNQSKTITIQVSPPPRTPEKK